LECNSRRKCWPISVKVGLYVADIDISGVTLKDNLHRASRLEVVKVICLILKSSPAEKILR
jgi:hypothetical protein